MNRRQFGLAMAAFGVAADVQGERKTEVEKFQLSRSGWMPNCNRLPVLLYRGAFNGEGMATQMEAVLEQNLWPAQWRTVSTRSTITTPQPTRSSAWPAAVRN